MGAATSPLPLLVHDRKRTPVRPALVPFVPSASILRALLHTARRLGGVRASMAQRPPSPTTPSRIRDDANDLGATGHVVSRKRDDEADLRVVFSSEADCPVVSTLPSEALKKIGLELPPPPRPAGTYTPVVVENGLAWVAGQIALESGSVVRPGLVDREVTVESAQDVARRASLQAVSALASALGSIDRVRRIVRVTVYVASSPGFSRQLVVANGATQGLVDLFGENGRPSRVAIGVAGLPLGAPVEVELVAAVG